MNHRRENAGGGTEDGRVVMRTLIKRREVSVNRNMLILIAIVVIASLSGCQGHDITPTWWLRCELEQGIIQKPLLRLTILTMLEIAGITLCIAWADTGRGMASDEKWMPALMCWSVVLVGPPILLGLAALLSYVVLGDVYYCSYVFLVFVFLSVLNAVILFVLCAHLARILPSAGWSERTFNRSWHRHTARSPQQKPRGLITILTGVLLLVIEIFGIIFTVKDIILLFWPK